MKTILVLVLFSLSTASAAPLKMTESEAPSEPPMGREMSGDSGVAPEPRAAPSNLKQVVTEDDEAPEATDPGAPQFRLEHAITETDPRVFGRRLSELLGVDVRLNFDGRRKLTLEAKEWTATEALNRVARQLKGVWGVEFSLAPIPAKAKTTVTPPKRLLSLGKVSVEAPSMSLGKALQIVAQKAGCRFNLPRELPAGKVRLSYKDTPVERALTDLAAKAQRIATPTVVIELPETAEARVAAEQVERLQEEFALTGEVNAYLLEAYGSDASDESFPWDNIDVDDLSITLAARLDITPDLAGDLLTKVRGESIALRQTMARERETSDPDPAIP